MSQAIHPLYEKQNRRSNRGFIREFEKIEPYIAALETKFELALFKAPRNLTYQDLYNYFHDEWKQLVNRLLLEFELKYSMIDIHHFPRLYRPIEGTKKRSS